MSKNLVGSPSKQTVMRLTSGPEDTSWPAKATLHLYANPDYRVSEHRHKCSGRNCARF